MSIAVALLAPLAVFAPAACSARAAAPALDHAIVVVRDLEQASASFKRLGFLIKPGRLHANGLLNRHIKFRDGTEIELMTVQGEARDAMARDYAELIEAGVGGVYVALRVPALVEAERAAANAGLERRRSASGPWQFLSFPAASPAASVFFTSGNAAVQDSGSIFQHDPRVEELAEVWIEGGAPLFALLRALGADRCGRVRAPDGRAGQRWALRRGYLVIVPPRVDARPRVLGVVLSSPAPRAGTLYPMRTFWIQYRNRSETP